MASRSAMGSNKMMMRGQIKDSPVDRAAEYLRRIARLTGARQIPGGGYRLTAGRRNFVVDSKFVYAISHHHKSTCFSVGTDPDIPTAEIIASALLTLKNNPKLFKKWRTQPGCKFKANGKRFRNLSLADWI